MNKKIFIFIISFLFLFSFNSFLFADKNSEEEIDTIENLKSDLDYLDALFNAAKEKYNESKYSFLTSPLRLYGYLTARFQNVTGFGRGYCNHTSFEQFIGLWVNGAIGGVTYRMLLNLERPKDESREIPNYWGTGRVFIDEFSLNADLNNFKISTGFLWENSLVIKNIAVTDRPMLFEKDLYQSQDDSTKAKYDTAFLKGYIPLDYRWTNIPIMGADATFDIFGRTLKIIAGRPNKYYDDYTPTFRNVVDARLDLGDIVDYAGPIDKFNMQIEAFNLSNDYGDIIGFNSDVDMKREGNTIYLGKSSLKINETFKITTTYGESSYYRWVSPTVRGHYFEVKFDGDIIKPITGFNFPITIGIYKIDPHYTEILGNIIDTRKIGDSELDVHLDKFYSDITDPTILSNNSEGLYFHTQFRVPNLLINLRYRYNRQIEPTGPEIVNTHFLNGINLNMALWWHLFYSSYGYYDPIRDKNWLDYNKTYADANGNTGVYRYLYTGGWRNNHELIVLKDSTKTQKKWVAGSVDLRFDIGNILGLTQSLFLGAYSELSTLTNNDLYFPNMDPSELFITNINDIVLAYNIIKPMNILFDYAWEIWKTDMSKGYPVDYTYTNYGFGIDWDVTKNVDLYFKTKYFVFNDAIKPANNFSGYYVFCELKNYF